jgi:GNAT superfamily N-acetyltransferase
MSRSLSATLCFAPNVDWHEDRAFTRYITGLPDPYGNIVWNAHLGDNPTDAEIAAILAPVASRNVPALWVAGPTSEPSNLPKRLLSHGFAAADACPAMAIELKEVRAVPIPKEAAVEEVCDDSALAAWLEVLAEGSSIVPEVAAAFGHWPKHLGLSPRSPMRAFLARLDGEPVSCSLLFLDAGIAGIYCVATKPAARGKGLGSAMTMLPLLEARKAGYQVGVLQASAMGEPIYRKIGFHTFGTIPVMVRPGSQHE